MMWFGSEQRINNNSKDKGWPGEILHSHLRRMKPRRRWGTQTFVAGFRKTNATAKAEADPCGMTNKRTTPYHSYSAVVRLRKAPGLLMGMMTSSFGLGQRLGARPGSTPSRVTGSMMVSA